MRRVQLLVSGVVQGVGFRWNTVIQAQGLGLTGWVRNRADGRVECQAQGPAAAVEALVDWARQGPRHAQVDAVEVEELAPEPGEDRFRCRDDG